jgi:ribosomal-protein-alanine N-acetyltransferase
MTVDDIPAVVAIDRMSFTLPWPERSYRYELTENAASWFFVAELAGEEETRVLGYVGFWLVADEVHISTIAVHPEFRRQGIGELLLRTALEKAKQFGAEMATLEVRASNHGAIQLYQLYGFEVVGRRKGYYHDNQEDAILMTLHHVPRRWPRSEGGLR